MGFAWPSKSSTKGVQPTEDLYMNLMNVQDHLNGGRKRVGKTMRYMKTCSNHFQCYHYDLLR